MTYADLMPPIGALRPDEVDHEAELALIHALDDWPYPDPVLDSWPTEIH